MSMGRASDRGAKSIPLRALPRHWHEHCVSGETCAAPTLSISQGPGFRSRSCCKMLTQHEKGWCREGRKERPGNLEFATPLPANWSCKKINKNRFTCAERISGKWLLHASPLDSLNAKKLLKRSQRISKVRETERRRQILHTLFTTQPLLKI